MRLVTSLRLRDAATITEDRIEWRRFMTSPYRSEEEEEALV